MKNNVLIATALHEHARIYIFNSTEMVEKARTLHGLWPTSCAALGRTLSVTALMGLMQKDENETVTVTINGGGPIGTILCVGRSNGEVKGFCGDPFIYETYENTHKLAVGKAVGTGGYLKVTKNLKLNRITHHRSICSQERSVMILPIISQSRNRSRVSFRSVCSSIRTAASRRPER